MIRRSFLWAINLALAAALTITWREQAKIADLAEPAHMPLHQPPAPHPRVSSDHRPAQKVRFHVEPPSGDAENAPGSELPRPMRLVGVAFGELEKVALIERDGEMVRVLEGDELDGWIVTRIERRKVRIESKDSFTDLMLDAPPSP